MREDEKQQQGSRHSLTSSLEQEGRKEEPAKAPPFGKEEQPPKAAPFGKGDIQNFNAWQLAWELGYSIAIPIVALALVGRWADRMLGTSPWLLLAGIVLSIFISSALVYRRIKKIL